MAVISNNILAGASGQSAGAAGYEIERSLRFNSADSAYCRRYPSSASNQKTWTWSGWVKRSAFGTSQYFFGNYHTSAALDGTSFRFTASDQIDIFDLDSGSFAYQLTSTQLFRDPSAWYHFVIALDTTQATAADRLKVYVNGSEITVWTTSSYPSQNTDYGINNTYQHAIGRSGFYNGQYFNGYIADVHFIDGQALSPTDFGEFDADTGVWNPIKYAGTYGTNGFHLDFSDNSSASALGTDSSGNGNNWTVNNISVTAGADNDSLFDSPTNGTQTDTGAGGEVSGNYATWNPLFVSSNSARTTISNGNLDVTSVTTPGNYAAVFATLGISSGKFYWEVTQNNSAAIMLGIAPASNPRNNYYLGESSNEWGYYSGNGTVYSGGSSAASYTQYSTGDVVGIAFDADNGKLFFSLNGTWQGSSNPAAGTNPAASGITTLPQFPAVSEGTASQTLDVSANFGQRPYAYTAPSGFKALCTANLPDPTIADGSTAMDVALYTGNGGDLDVTGLSFNPDLVWGKARSNSLDHFLQDSVRGVSNVLRSNTTGAEAADGCLASFNSDGFSVNPVSLSNQTSTTYVGWAWDGGASTVSNTDGSITSSVRANASAGFSIVSYTGTNSDATVGHGLGVTPSLIIVKCRTTATYSTTDWYVFTQPTGKDAFLVLNKPDASASNSGFWGTPNSSTFGVKNASGNNVSSSDDHIAYCFAPVEGYSAFGSYTGNGSSDGPFVYTGFRPRWMLLRNADNTTGVDWILLDTARDTYNIADARLRANTSDQEGTESFIDITSNGFKVRTGGQLINGSGQTVIYAAFAEHPFKTARAR